MAHQKKFSQKRFAQKKFAHPFQDDRTARLWRRIQDGPLKHYYEPQCLFRIHATDAQGQATPYADLAGTDLAGGNAVGTGGLLVYITCYMRSVRKDSYPYRTKSPRFTLFAADDTVLCQAHGGPEVRAVLTEDLLMSYLESGTISIEPATTTYQRMLLQGAADHSISYASCVDQWQRQDKPSHRTERAQQEKADHEHDASRQAA